MTFDGPIIERFEAMVDIDPARPAVVTREASVSFGELDEWSSRYARGLARHETNTPVALLMSDPGQLVAAMFGCIRSGRPWVVLDTSFPRDRNVFFLEDSGAGTILCDQINLRTAGDLAAPECRIVSIGDVEPLDSTRSLFAPDSDDQAVAITYTSGSSGFRVETAEMEGTLTSHPAVHEAVVVGKRDENGEASLVAVVVATEGVQADDIRAYLASRLPDYMIPESVRILDELPLSASGKVDRRQLLA